MRVLFVNRMASMERGGGETFDLEIARHLAKLGCDISFLSGVPLFGKPKTPITVSSIQYPVSSYTIRSPYFGWFPWDKVRGGWRLRLADFWMFERRAAAWLKKRGDDFDVIQACELPVFVQRAKREGVRAPIVMRLTAPNYYDSSGGIRAADAVIASGMTVEQVRSSGRPDCVDIPNAVDTDIFKPQPTDFRKRFGIGDDETVVLYVARFQDFKNHAMLLRAWRFVNEQRPRSRLVLVGGGPLLKRAKIQAVELGISKSILFLGEVKYEELPRVYAAVDIKAVSSDFESFCFAALEAMATGLPLVTTDCGWVPKLIRQGEGGLIVPVGDEVAFAKALASLADNAGLRKAMGETNRRKAVDEHGWDTSARNLLSLYERLL